MSLGMVPRYDRGMEFKLRDGTWWTEGRGEGDRKGERKMRWYGEIRPRPETKSAPPWDGGLGFELRDGTRV